MITGFSRRAVLAATLLALSGLAAAGCQRVPLLAPSGSTITLTAVATALPVNGTTDIVAQVIEPAGTPPHTGTHISFMTSLGRIEPSEAQTDINGRAAVKFVAGGASGTATITAASGGATVGASGALKIAVGAAAVGRVVIDANPGIVSSSGGTSTITAFVFDPNGNALGAIPMTFTTDAGTVSPSTVIADANGQAQTILTTNRTAKVTVTAGNLAASGGGTGSGSGSGPGGTTSSPQSATVTVTVNSGPSVVLTSSTTTPLAGQAVSFTVTPGTVAAGGSPIQRITVDFGDGSPVVTLGAATATVNHIFTSPGTYTMTATATDSSGDRGTGTLILAVANRPPANVTITANPASPQVGQSVTLTITTTFPSGITAAVQSVSVDFGDSSAVINLGAQATATVQHVYQTAGAYIVTATVRDTSGGSSLVSTAIFVTVKPPANVTITANPASPQVGQSVTLTITTTFPSGITAAVQSVSVNFGDSSAVINLGAQATATVQHVYQTAGAYTVTATVRDTSGTSSSVSTAIFVTVKPPLTVSLAASPNPATTVNNSVLVTFTATPPTTLPAGVFVDHYEWNFGDGSAVRTTTSATTTRIYTSTGTFVPSVTLVATDNTRASASIELQVK